MPIPSTRDGAGPAGPGRLQALLGAALELSGEHEFEAVLRRIVEGAAAIAEAAYAALGIYDETGAIESFITHGIDENAAARIGAPPQGRGLLGEVIVASGPIRVEDIGTDPRSCGFPACHPPMRSFLGVPVGHGGRRYGNLYLTEKAGGMPFGEEDEALVAAYAAFAACAIESARLVASERARAEAVAELAAAEERDRLRRQMLGEILDAQEAERARVARDLHDDVGQALTSVLLGLRLVESSLGKNEADLDDARLRTEEVRDLVADALGRTRHLAFELRPTVLDDMGLLAALERLVADTSTRTATAVGLATHGVGDDRLAPEIETVAYRVVQEALTNVARHSQAKSASVTVSVAEGRLRALVEDDGVGFDPVAAARCGHLGLEGMAERAALVGGSLETSSAPGAGATVRLEVPLG
ncbi:MAG: GAF domain-containing sensor histidine kinase [Acidimicrobiales bacterium]|nr:GAF domain-containing sensor histidine kinase [Acidimicrobiales bacterium]